MAEALLIRLAHEEVIYLLRALDIAHLGNLTPETLGDLDDDHRALVMAVADRTLRARAMVHWKDAEHRDVDGVVAGALRACAAPRFTLEIDVRRADQPAHQLRYAFTERVAVEQAIAEPGVYQFLTTISASDVLRALAQLLQLDEPLDETPETAPSGDAPSVIALETLTAARDLAVADPVAARRLLESALSSSIATHLIDVFTAPTAAYSLEFRVEPVEPVQPVQPVGSNQPTQGVTPSRDPIEQRWLTILQSATSHWLLRREGSAPTRVVISTATAAQELREVEVLLRPAITLLAATHEHEGAS